MQKQMKGLDALIYAVPHDWYGDKKLLKSLDKKGVLIDIKSQFEPEDLPKNMHYWSL